MPSFCGNPVEPVITPFQSRKCQIWQRAGAGPGFVVPALRVIGLQKVRTKPTLPILGSLLVAGLASTTTPLWNGPGW
jgi:hypothetical protein